MPELALLLDATHSLLWKEEIASTADFLPCAGLSVVISLALDSNHIGRRILILSRRYALLRSMPIGAAPTLSCAAGSDQ